MKNMKKSKDDYSQKLKHTDIIYLFLLIQGIDLKTRKQEYYCFLVEQFYFGHYEGRNKHTSLLLVVKKLFIMKTKILLMKFLFSFFFLIRSQYTWVLCVTKKY